MSSKNRTFAILILFVLIGFSFLKDNLTPDLYNTPAASFLKHHPHRIDTLYTHYDFWLLSFAYSLIFLILPCLVIHLFFSNKSLTMFTLAVCALCMISIYVLVWFNHPLLDRALIPKINRYYHSPIITFFLLASFTIIEKK